MPLHLSAQVPECSHKLRWDSKMEEDPPKQTTNHRVKGLTEVHKYNIQRCPLFLGLLEELPYNEDEVLC